VLHIKSIDDESRFYNLPLLEKLSYYTANTYIGQATHLNCRRTFLDFAIFLQLGMVYRRFLANIWRIIKGFTEKVRKSMKLLYTEQNGNKKC